MTTPSPPLPQRRSAATAVALLLALASSLWRITKRPLWIDEAFSLGATNQLVDTIRSTGGTMALYYVLLNGWTAGFGTSVLALRSLSILLVLAAILVLSTVAYRLLPPAEAGLSLVVVALLPSVLQMAQNARAYALVMLVTVACWACLARAVEADARDDPRSTWRWSLALVPLVVAGELSHGLFLLQLPPLVLSIAVHLRQRRPLLGALVPAVAAGVATLAFLLLAFDAGTVGEWILPLSRAQVEALGTQLLARHWPIRLALAVLLVVGAVTLARRLGAGRSPIEPSSERVAPQPRPTKVPADRWATAAPLWWALTPVVSLIALSAVRPSLLGRYVSGSLPAIGMLIAVGLHAVWRAIVPAPSVSGADAAAPTRRPSHVGRWAVAAVLVVAAISLPVLDRTPPWPGTRFEDWDATADYIGTRAEPGDGIVFVPIGKPVGTTDTLRAPFEAAWTGRPGPRVDLEVLSPPRPLGEVRRLEAGYDPADLSARLVEHDRVWVVLVPTGWDHLLDALDREPARSQMQRDPHIEELNGGMQVVLLTRR